MCSLKTGKKWENKLDAVREKIKAMECDAMVVTALDEIAWLLNIRGYDIPYGPFVKSYAIISKDQLHLYIDSVKLSPIVRKHLLTDNCYSAHCARSVTFSNVICMYEVWSKSNGNFHLFISNTFLYIYQYIILLICNNTVPLKNFPFDTIHLYHRFFKSLKPLRCALYAFSLTSIFLSSPA